MPPTEKTIFEKLKTTSTDNEEEEQKYNFFENIGKPAYLFLFAVITLILLLAFKDFIFFDKFYVFKGIATDSIDALYPYLYNTTHFFSKHHLPTWSFSYGMGQNTFPFFLRDPFDILLYITGKNYLLTGIVFIEIIKIILTGLIFFAYLKKLEFTDFTALLGALFYCFCSYMIIGSVWHFFSFEVLNMALLLLAFETLLADNKWMFFPFPFFFMGVTMPLNLYFYGVFIISYAILRLIQTNQFSIINCKTLFLKMLALGIIGILISSPFLLENIAQLIESPRVGGGNSLSHILATSPIYAHSPIKLLGTCAMRLFSNDILGSADGYKGWRNVFEAPMFYCGLPCLLLLPQLFSFLPKKTKTFFLVFIAIWLIPVFFPWFRYAFWLFSGNYFRVYSFFVSLIMLYYALQALDFIILQKQINIKILICTVFAIVLLLYFPYFKDKSCINKELQALVLVLILVYGSLLYAIGKKNSEPYFKIIFFLIIVFELYYFTATTVSGWDAITAKQVAGKKGYNDYTNDAINYLKQHDTTFYRIDKNYSSSLSANNSLNDALVQDYNGTSAYSSFNQVNYINYLQTIGVADPKRETQARWARGLTLLPIPESENCVKYFLVKKTLNPEWFLFADSIYHVGDVTIYKNKLALPFGYTYQRYIKKSEYNKLDSYQKICTGIMACVVEDKDTAIVNNMKELKRIDLLAINTNDTISIVNEFNILKSEVPNLTAGTLTTQAFKDTYFSGSINTKTEKILYLSIPYDNGWHLLVDNLPANKLILSGGMTGVFLSPGLHTITMQYQQRFTTIGICLSILGIILFVGIWRLKFFGV